MRRETELIAESRILEAIVSKIERDYPQDISVLACYGSFVTRGRTKISDIDFYFIPKSNRGSSLSFQFIIAGIGYDLFPLSRERAARIAALEDPLTSLIMDARLLFICSDEDVRAFERLRSEIRGHLADESYCRSKVTAMITEIRAAHFRAARVSGRFPMIEIYAILEKMLFALSLINGTYLEKGIKNTEREVLRFANVPPNFLDDFRQVIRFEDRERTTSLLAEMIDRLAILAVPANGAGRAADPGALIGFYEELKSIYNKLIEACESADYSASIYAAILIDRETAAMPVGESERAHFPEMAAPVRSHDYAGAIEVGRRHEELLRELLHARGVTIHSFENEEDFIAQFLRRP